MDKIFLRVVAILLVPCLLVGPGLAQPCLHSKPAGLNSLFTERAINAPLAGANFLTERSKAFIRTVREYVDLLGQTFLPDLVDGFGVIPDRVDRAPLEERLHRK